MFALSSLVSKFSFLSGLIFSECSSFRLARLQDPTALAVWCFHGYRQQCPSSTPCHTLHTLQPLSAHQIHLPFKVSESLLGVLSAWIVVSSPGWATLKTSLKCVLCGAFQIAQAKLEALMTLYFHEMSLLSRQCALKA